MRWGWVILTTVFLLFLPVIQPDVSAEEALNARVVSLDPDKGVMVVSPISADDLSDEITVFYSPDQIPPIFEAGDVIRIRGEWSAEDRRHFTANHIGYGRNAIDPTGVRSRIGKCRGFRGGRIRSGGCKRGMGKPW